MSETREQFRERIKDVLKQAQDAYEDNPPTPKPSMSSPFDEQVEWHNEWDRRIAEAVYAQALHDVMQDMGHRFGSIPASESFQYLSQGIEHFAADLGIDLDGGAS